MALDECNETGGREVFLGNISSCDITVLGARDTIIQPVYIPDVSITPDKNVVVDYTPVVKNNNIQFKTGIDCQISQSNSNEILIDKLPSNDIVIELFSLRGGLQEAPKTGQLYGRKDGQWIVIPPSKSCTCPSPPTIEPPVCGGSTAALFVTDVTNSGSGLVANKVYLPGTVPANQIVTEALTDDNTVTIHFMAEGGSTYSPTITVDGIQCTNLQQYSNDRRLFFGSVDIIVDESRVVSLQSSENSEADVRINRAEAPPEILTLLIGSPPGSQTAVKAGDTVTISGTTEDSATQIKLDNYGACNGTDWLPVSNGSFLFQATVSSLSGLRTVRATVRNSIGSAGQTKESDNNILLDQQYPEFTFNSILYPTGQSAFKGNESGQIDVEVLHSSSVVYSSPTGEFNISLPNTYEQVKIINFTNTGGYNDSHNNYRINAYKAANGSSSIFNHVIHVADKAPVLSISQSVNRLQSSPTGRNYLIQANSDQILTSPPSLNIPVSGVWVGNFTGFEKHFTCHIKITDGDASGTAPYALVSNVYNEAGMPASITGNQSVGGFIQRDIDLPPFADQVTLDARVTDIQKLVMSWSFKAGMVFQPIGTPAPVVSGWTIDAVNQDTTEIIILDSSAANASSQTSTITIMETV
jgi:hypothetical protein